MNCLECHQPAPGQDKKDHHGFVISAKLTAGNCRGCHENIYQQFLRSRHAAPAWAAIYGGKGAHAGVGEFFGNVPTRRHAQAAASVRAHGRRIGHDQRV